MDKRKSEHPRPPAVAGRAPLDLSVCFIARDEERDLPRALASVRRVAREIIVVDTGSRDATPQIARAAGARVIHHAFEDHFARARNVAVEAATMPWILMLDADEALEQSSLPALARALRDPALAQVVLVHHIIEDAEAQRQAQKSTAPPRGPALCGQRPRGAVGAPLQSLLLFRRHPGIRYQGRVHENIVASLLRLGAESWPYSGVQVAHYGYQDQAERQRKTQRNLQLLEQAVAEEPGDLYLQLKLAQTLPRGERRRVVLAGALALAEGLPTEALHSYPFLPRLLALQGGELLVQGALVSAQRLALGFGARLGPAGAFTCGRLLVQSGALAAGEAVLHGYLAGAWGGGALLLPDPEASPAAALHLLGFAALLRGAAEPAATLLRRALAAGPEGPRRFGAAPAIEGDLVRCAHLLGQYREVAAGLARLEAGIAAGGGRWAREALLVSGEISLVQGSLETAQALLRQVAEGDAEDDRGAALYALASLHAGDRAEALGVLPLILGTSCETQGLRLVLARHLDPRALPQPEEVPAFSEHLAALYSPRLAQSAVTGQGAGSAGSAGSDISGVPTALSA